MALRYRINAKKLYFVYNQINKNISIGVILKQLETKLVQVGIKKYFMVFEPIAGSESLAILHVILVLGARCDITKENYFNLRYKKEEFAGTYKTAKGLPSLLEFLVGLNTCNHTNMDLEFLVKKRKKEVIPQFEDYDSEDEKQIIAFYNKIK